MYLYFIRHGQPDYATDTLLPEGIEQARAVARRMQLSNIEEIHSSPMGRALQTAQPTAKLLGLPIITEEWAFELGKESYTTFPNGQPRIISSVPSIYMHSRKYLGMGVEESLDRVDCFQGCEFKQRYHSIVAGLDGLLAKLGYQRNDDGLYDAISPNRRHIALFCHAGMMRVMLSHLFHAPYQLFAGALQTHFTGVTVIHFAAPPYIAACERPSVDYTPENLDQLPAVFPVQPSLISYGDIGHLYNSPANMPVHYLHKDAF